MEQYLVVLNWALSHDCTWWERRYSSIYS